MIDILFVIDKYIDKNTKLLTSDLTGEMSTCQDHGFNPHFLYTDEINNINFELLDNLCSSDDDIDVVVFSYNAGYRQLNPTVETLGRVKDYFPDLKMVFVWWDVLFHRYIRECITDVDKFADQHICFDGSDLKEIGLSEKGVTFPCPQPDELFFPDEKIIGVSFLGRINTYADRVMYINYLAGNGLNINLRGGRIEDNLSDKDYAQILRQSKININFPLSQDCTCYQYKERIYQSLASKSLVLEMENPLTRKYLEPNKDYVEFTTPHDLLEKIYYYVENPIERNQIIEHGYKTYHEKYHHKIMWEYLHNFINAKEQTQ